MNVDQAFSQPSTAAKQNHIADWSELFPEIPDCEREIQPIKRNGEVWEQVAVYEREGYKNNKNENYVGCGSITLRFESLARIAARQRSTIADFPSHQPIQIKNFEAYQDSPQCGNDFWMGSTAVYFDEDKVLIVSANAGAGAILEFAQNADYELLRKSIGKLVADKTRRKKKGRFGRSGPFSFAGKFRSPSQPRSPTSRESSPPRPVATGAVRREP